ncbi:hypothetical protein [Pseudonocardia nigra]|uniref:hypothetical protein n=1 Tax=Pseudonocardia nigra TaxID=1921578 RepID=UPI001C5ED4F7|nr:hypothetical protein [Pseudonocardia nigra]
MTENLVAEFSSRFDQPAISLTVRNCLRELQGSPSAARVVGLERLARDRLLAHLEIMDDRPCPTAGSKPSDKGRR